MQSLPRILKMLRENSNIKEKREALTYIRSNSKKLESTKAIKEEQYKELCKLIVDAFAYGNNDIQNEAYETLNVVIREFKGHTLNLFEAISQISQKHRLKILKLLEVVEENAISTFASDPHAVNFFNNCLYTIQTNTMPWLAPTAVDNIQALIEAESKHLSEDQRLEEETINYCITFLRRLYKIAVITSDIKIERFNALLMGKIVPLAYMGHKRQRGPALKLLQQALATDIVTHVHTTLPNLWNQYVTALQTTYWKRMLLLVSACELDWATQWNVSIQFLGMHLHRGAGLINNLLSVEEKAFKSTDTIIRRQAFLSWKLLVDNFALDPQELATPRRIKLLCIPLNAKNSKTELIALTKLEVWWHVIVKLYKDIAKCVNPVITQFLNFCFGPLGDTPLLSSKYDIVASPGKKFFKTKLVAVDALCQLLVTKQENAVFSAILEERLPHSITDAVFQQCYKSIIHSVGEALLVLSQLTDAEVKNRYQLGKILWTSLVNYVQESKMDDKGVMYKNIVLVITELTNYAGDKPMIRNLILDLILFEITDLSKNFNFQDDTLSGLLFKLLQTPSILNGTDKEHYDVLKRLFWHCIKSQTESVYYSHAFTCLKKMNYILHESITTVKKESVFELWLILADVLGKYMSDIQEIDEGTTEDHNLNTVESIVVFPFAHLWSDDMERVQEVSKVWKHLYKQYEMRTDLMSSVKSNEILLSVASKMQDCLKKNGRSSCLIVRCLDVLLSTINYKLLLAYTEVPSITHLLVDLTLYFLHNRKIRECEVVIKALSSVVISIYVQSMEKVIPYLYAVKPAIEAMLQTKLEELHKETKNTWETVIIVFKGLDKEINSDLISSYKKAIIQALNHPHTDVQRQTVDWFVGLYETRNSVDNDRKLTLEEIEKAARGISKREIMQKKNNQVEGSVDSGKTVGSFLHRSSSPKSAVKESDKKSSVDTKKISIDSDSQDYVLIKTDVKFDVNRLTEHQKESLKRRREDIQAIYADLSQSSSQDTEHLQEWFDKKSKSTEEAEKGHNKKDNSSMKGILDDDANKENKIEAKELEIICKPIEHDAKPAESVGQNSTLEIVQKVNSNGDNNEIPTRGSQATTAAKTTLDNAETKASADLGTKDAISTNQEEPSENIDDQRLSPSMLDSGKRRKRYTFPGRSNTLVNSEDVTSSQSQQEDVSSSQPRQSSSAQTLQRTLRTKAIQSKLLLRANAKKSLDNAENKMAKEDKKGTKRRSASEDETEGTVQRQRRKITHMDTISDDDSTKSTEQDNEQLNLEDMSQVDKRTRKEMYRLRINMVFDSPLSTYRRSKSHEDNSREITPRRQSPEFKNYRSKIPEPKGKGCRPTKLRKPDKIADLKRASSSKKSETEEEKTEDANISPDNKSSSDLQEIEIESGLADENDQNENDTEDIIEDSQTFKLEKNKIYKTNSVQQTVEVNKIESAKETSKASDAPGTEAEEKREDENMQEEEISKAIDNDKSEGNGEAVDDDKPSNVVEDANEDNKSKESQTQIQTDTVDIIESSQDLTGIDKKFNDMQCMIKVRKIEHTSPPAKAQENIVGDNEIIDADSNNCDNDSNEVPRSSVKALGEVNEVCAVEPKISTPVIETNPCDNEKDATPETQKVNDPSTSKFLLDFQSPKSNVKRQMKFKSYSGQGRAAHMLGLATKQARLEAGMNVITIDEEPLIKKTKGKDAENDTVLSKKDQGTTLKDIDKVTSACSSRQEKIFSNMRSADYCLSPSMKLFSSLKNDGEKFFSKDKSVDCIPLQTDAQTDKASEETSSEAAELPILEWSSANPPSLTASPRASILKRQRQSFPELDPESTTPSKRRRVSFADPLVSKEMGYETTESPHKSNKFASRSLLMRKDSPFRLKHTKHRMMSIDSDKLDNAEDVDATSTTEVDLQCERENEMLTKIAEELEYTESIMDAQTLCSATENESASANTYNPIKIDKLSGEFEITERSTFSKRVETTPTRKDETLEKSRNSDSSLECNELDDSKTQDEVFTEKVVEDNYSGKVTKVNSNLGTPGKATSAVNSIMLDSLKFSVENESIIEHSSEKRTNSENLEDTMDAANLTGLNSSANSDEIFCDKLIRTSTQTSENIQDQDTLPVTDSVFASLPLSQETSSNEFNVEIPQPELLDSVHPIYPGLMSCKESVAAIIDHLTYPLWAQSLSTHLTNKHIHTIGDLARLSEREVNRIPVKGNSKVEFVKSVLRCFEKMRTGKETNGDAHNEASSSVNTNVPASTPKEMSQGHDTINNSANNTMPVSQPSSQIFESTIEHEKSVAKMSDDIEITECILQKPGPSKTVTGSNTAGNSSAATGNAVPVTQNRKTVGTCTSSDSVYFSKTVANKATKSVAAQMSLAELLDEIDVNLVLESAARRCSPEKLLMQYKDKMRHVPQVELETETLRVLSSERINYNEVTLKAACRACGVNKVLLRLPDIFCTDKEFFVKVLNAYKKKIRVNDCLNILDFNEVKSAVCERGTTQEIADMFSKKLQEEEQQGTRKVMTELSSLDSYLLLKRMPVDVIISNTVANDELISSAFVLDIALQNNSANVIAQALKSQSPSVMKTVFDALWSPELAAKHLPQSSESKEDLLKSFKEISSKLSEEDLLQAFYESMQAKLLLKEKNN